jgi:hypothetical protein
MLKTSVKEKNQQRVVTASQKDIDLHEINLRPKVL